MNSTSTDTTCNYARIFSSSTLYSFLFFLWWGHKASCAFPITRATHKNTRLSATQAHAKPPSARINKKTLKSVDMSVNCIILTSHVLGSKSRYAANKNVVTTVTTKGTAKIQQWHSCWTRLYVQLFLMVWRNGGPTLSTMPEKMYWKQETKNNVVFSEFSILDFSWSTCGGWNLSGD